MVSYKDFVKSQFIGKKVRFLSDCIVKIDIEGIVIGAEQSGSEILYLVDTGKKIVKIGENTSKLKIEFM